MMIKKNSFNQGIIQIILIDNDIIIESKRHAVNLAVINNILKVQCIWDSRINCGKKVNDYLQRLQGFLEEGEIIANSPIVHI